MPKIKAETKKKKLSVKPVEEAGLTADVFNFEGQIVKKIELPKSIFGLKVNDKLLAQAVRVYGANQRQGNASTKTRGEVAGSTRKIYRQKGTGRARHGSIKAPVFVGGGTVFGPHPHDFSLKIPQKMKKQALKNALSDQYQNKNIIFLDNLENLKAKTSQIVKLLNNLKLKIKQGSLQEKTLLITLPNSNLFKASHNLANLTLATPSLLNSFEVLLNKKIIILSEAVKFLLPEKKTV